MHKETDRQTNLLHKAAQECNGLDGFPKPHLVGQDGVGVLCPGEPQPVESFQLVAMESATSCCDVRWLFLVLLLWLCVCVCVWGGGGVV